MPLYEYECIAHGVFEVLRGLAEYAAPADCPDCARPAPRVVSVPQRASLPRGTRLPLDRKERSRHEPVHTRGSHEHVHPRQTPVRPALKQYTGKRPWVIEHG